MEELKYYVNNIIGVDVKGLNTREEVISKLINESKDGIGYIFDKLTEEEQLKYYVLLNQDGVYEYLNKFDFKEKLNLLKNVINKTDEYRLSNFVIYNNDDQFSYDFLKLYSNKLNDFYICKIICNMKDEKLINVCTDLYIKDDYYKTIIIKSFNDDVKEEYIGKMKKESHKVELILSLKDVEKRKYYALLPEFSNYRSDLIVGTNDSEFIKEKFKETEKIKLKLNIIKKVKDSNLKLELIKLLDDGKMSDFLLSNVIEQASLIKDLKGTKIDENITIGIELECCNINIKDYLFLKNIFKDYVVKKDSSVRKGFEIVSPVIKYNLEDMNTLKNVCELLNKHNFYTDKSCGGHIHIGASYLNRWEDYLMLVYLYTNVEEILYYISDKEKTPKRVKVNEYASKTKRNYLKAVNEGIFNNVEFNGSIKEMFEKINNNRYKGMNLKNIGGYIKNTIEFRMPNGEINYDELLLNIKLFARLIEMSHKLNDVDTSKDLKNKASLLASTKSERLRLELLLDILFTDEEEKEKYRNRYIKNKKLDLLNMSNMLNEVKVNLFGTDNIVFDEDNKTLIKKSVK